jgi:hypothetical protein
MMDETGSPVQYTICRPIGFTKVPSTGYVMILSEHVNTYAMAKEHPYAKAAEHAVDTARDAYFAKTNFYKEVNGEYHWKDALVKDVFREASRKREEAEKKARKDFFEAEAKAGRFPVGHSENPGKGTRAKTCHTYVDKVPPVVHFTPTGFEAGYEGVAELWKKSDEFQAAKKSADALLADYETLGGSDGATPQKPIPWLEGVPPERVKGYMLRYLTEQEAVLKEIAKYRELSGKVDAK